LTLSAQCLQAHWRDQGKRTQARDLRADLRLVPEGFDTPDLKEAKALLEGWE